MNHSTTSQLSSRGAMPTPARSSLQDADWSHRWRRLRDAIVPPEERVLRSARRGRPVILGTAAEPWETLPDRHRLLSALDGYAGLRLRFTCRTDCVLEDAEILAWLDRDHAVRVEFRLEADRLLHQGFKSPYVERICRALQGLASRGLETRLVLEPKDGAVLRGWRGAKSVVEQLARALAKAGAADLLLTEDAAPEWSRLIEPLRLAHGFAGAAGRSTMAARG